MVQKMSRKKRYYKNIILIDIKYGSFIVSKFINYIMKNGKKDKAQNIMYFSLNIISLKIKKNPLIILKKVLKNIQYLFELKKRKIGGAIYLIPMKINIKRSIMHSIKNLIKNAKNRNENGFKNKLVGEIMDTYYENSNSIKKRNELNKIIEQNKAYSSFKI